MKFKEAPGEIVEVEGLEQEWIVRGGPGIGAEDACEAARERIREIREEYGGSGDLPELIAVPVWMRWRPIGDDEPDDAFDGCTHWLATRRTPCPGWARGWAVESRSYYIESRKARILEKRVKAAIMEAFPEATDLHAGVYDMQRWTGHFILPEMGRVDIKADGTYLIFLDKLDAWDRLYRGRPRPVVQLPTDEEALAGCDL